MHLPSSVLRMMKAYDIYNSLSSQYGLLHIIGTQIFLQLLRQRTSECFIFL